jgi:expansin (peptidoglycan-binding protein)
MADDKDKAWIEVQKKAFTHWVNTTLEARHKSITNSIEVDLADGVLVIDFVELLIGNTKSISSLQTTAL